MSESSKQPLAELVAEIRAGGKSAVILARHGQTAANRERLLVGSRDVPLDEVGRDQAQKLARRLSPIAFDGVYASRLSRAIDTARSLSEPTICEGLEELNQGILEGQPAHILAETHADLLAAFTADPARTKIPGGESLGDVQKRAMAALHDIVQAPPLPKTVVIFTHQMTLASILCAATKQPLSAYKTRCHRNAALSVLAWSDGEWELLRFDDQAHIQGGLDAIW
jgi:broad specificity phosphatase PhoE